jgi:hypothetical protein
MFAPNPHDRLRFVGSKPVPAFNPRASRFRFYFDQLPEEWAEEFQGPTAAQPLSAADIRLHAWLSERLALLHRERHGLWSALRRFLFGNRFARWLASWR